MPTRSGLFLLRHEKSAEVCLETTIILPRAKLRVFFGLGQLGGLRGGLGVAAGGGVLQPGLWPPAPPLAVSIRAHLRFLELPSEQFSSFRSLQGLLFGFRGNHTFIQQTFVCLMCAWGWGHRGPGPRRETHLLEELACPHSGTLER